MAEYEANLPVLKAKVAELTENEENLKKTCVQMTEKTRGFKALLLNLELKENELKQQVVNEDEYDDIVESYNLFQNEFTELKQIQEATAASNLSTVSSIDEISKCIAEINSLIDSIKISDYEALM